MCCHDVLYRQTSEDVAQYNVLSMMHEVAYRSHYEPATDTQSDKKQPSDNSNGSNQSETEGNFDCSIHYMLIPFVLCHCSVM